MAFRCLRHLFRVSPPARRGAPTARKRAAQPAHADRPAQVYAQLRTLIVQGKLAPGSRIIETDIAELLGVSRTPVREAIQRLQQEGYVAGWHVDEPAEGAVGKTLVVELKYGPNRERTIAGVRRISKPGLRVYAKRGGLPRVLGGLGVAIISTSTGLLTDKQANKKGVGGEVLAYVW